MTIQAVVSDDRSFTNAMLAVMTVAWMHVTLAKAKTKWPAVGRIVDGTPVMLVENGEWHEDRLAKLNLHDMDVMAAVRQRGLMARDVVKYAVFERIGDTVMIPKNDHSDGQDGEGR